jgi:hypothetical protein
MVRFHRHHSLTIACTGRPLLSRRLKQSARQPGADAAPAALAGEAYVSSKGDQVIRLLRRRVMAPIAFLAGCALFFIPSCVKKPVM